MSRAVRPLAALAAPLAALALACAALASRPAAPAERFLTVDGAAGKLRVSDGGADRGLLPVVLVHGLGGDLDAWRAQLEHLRATRRAVAYDQRGHGGSERPRDGVYTIAALADDLDALARALRLERFVLAGHSMAGAVLTTYAAAHPERVAALVYVDAIGSFHVVPREAVEQMTRAEAQPSFDLAAMRAGFEPMLAPPARPETRARVLASLEKVEPRGFAALRRSMMELDARPLAARYGGPRFAIEMANAPYPLVLASALGPDVRRRTIEGVSHWLMMDDPGAFDAALDACLAEVDAGGAPR